MASYVYKQINCARALNLVVAEKWEKELGSYVSSSELKTHMKSIYLLSNVTKMRSFQFRLLHKALIMNVHLYRWGKRSDNLCSMCGEEPETIVHFFAMCSVVRNIWQKIREFVSEFSTMTVNFSARNILWNTVAEDNRSCINTVVLITKQYLYARRCLGQSIAFTPLKEYILYYKSLEKYNASINGQMLAHQRKWSPSNY